MLQLVDSMHWGHLKPHPKLELHHVKARLQWARKMSFVGVESWKWTIFTDKKRFCLDGTDGLAYFWSDRRLERGEFSKRQIGGVGVMVWARISWKGKKTLFFVDNTIGAVGYTRMLDDVY